MTATLLPESAPSSPRATVTGTTFAGRATPCMSAYTPLDRHEPSNLKPSFPRASWSVEIAMEVEQEGLDPELRAAERRPVADRQGRDELPFGRERPSGVGPERRDELVGLDADVRGWKAQAPADPVPGLDRPGHRVAAAEESVAFLHVAGRHEA